MSLLNNFTIAMKTLAAGTKDSADGDLRPGYCSGTEWEQFYNEMETRYPEAFRQFTEGDGGELNKKGSRPPKMASYASSSRMIYLLSRDCEGFVFEKKLPTTVGGTANLDGYLETPRCQFAVEAKCREPYSHTSQVKVSDKYKNYYEFLNEARPGGLSCEMSSAETGNMEVTYRVNGQPLSCFDMKQMLCHLLGVATGLLSGQLPPKPVEFLYLLYNPALLPLEKAAKEQVMDIYQRHQREAAMVDFAAVFACTLDFLAKEPLTRTYPFRFTLCDQQFYAARLDAAKYI